MDRNGFHPSRKKYEIMSQLAEQALLKALKQKIGTKIL